MAISSPLQSKVPTGSTKTIRKLQTILLNRTKVRREIFQQQTILQNRRIENERRKQREDELEAPNLVTKPRGAAGLIAGSAKGFFERLVGFLSYLTAGWIINNLPTWISMGKEFIARTQQMGKILGNFVGNVTTVFTKFTTLLGASLQNLMTFDFSDTSGRVKTAFDDLNLSVENWGTDFENAIKLITTPLSEGIASGEDARPLGTENTNEGAYERTAPYSGSQGPETSGGRVSSQAVYSYLKSLGVSEIHALGILANIQGESGFQIGAQEKGDSKQGVGLFQYTFPSRKQAFLKAVPDYKTNWKGQIDFAIKSDPNTPLYLRKQFSSPEQAADDFMIQWENPDPRVYADRRKTHNAFIKSFKPGSSQSQASQQSSPAQTSSPATGQSFNPLPGGSFKGGESQRFGSSRDGGDRKHLGLDITESNWKKGSDPRIPVVAVRSGVVIDKKYVAGSEYLSGLMIRQDDGYDARYLHMTPSLKPGDKVSAGQRIGRLVKLGRDGGQTHLHFELYKSSGGGALDPTSYITTIEKGGVPAAIARQQSPTPSPAQITPTGTPQNPQISQSLAPERTGPTVIVSQNPSSPPQQMMYSGGGGSSGGGSSPISDFALLNNFIKNKLLLDLAYL
jgi:murein DD-endopeptidase MepM/ murein hydrolase activator NlpD